MVTPPEEVARHFGLEETPALSPRYNVAPGQEVAVVRAEAGSGPPVLVRARWGLVPHWARDPGIGARLINARSETVGEKPAFREAFLRRRCLVPADAFFEWSATTRQPFRIHLRDAALFAFAGLWENWGGGDERGAVLETCTLLTTRANAELRALHDRMPVILSPGSYGTWLDPALSDPARLVPLLRPRRDGELDLHPVSRRVNSPAHDDPACVAPVGREPEPPTQLGLDLGPAGGDA